MQFTCFRSVLNIFRFMIIFSGILWGQEIRVKHPTRAHLNNICWSADSKMLAYESLETGKSIAVFIFEVKSGKLRKLLENPASGPMPKAAGGALKVTQPVWSSSSNNLFFLYNDGDYNDAASNINSERLIGRIDYLNIDNLPLKLKDGGSKGFDGVITVYKAIGQGENDIAEYHILRVPGGEDAYFLKYSQSPNSISLASKNVESTTMGKLGRINDKTKPIDSFALSTSGERIALVAGIDQEKRILIADILWEFRRFDSAKYYNLKVVKNETGILQEPSFNPTNSEQVAYLEFSSRGATMLDNELHLIEGWTEGPSDDGLITRTPKNHWSLKKNIYRNEKNKISRPNYPSYVWHPAGGKIFIIDEERHVEAISLGDEISYHKISPQLVKNAEQLAVSPNGEFLAVLTQAKSKIGEALSEIIILPLK